MLKNKLKVMFLVVAVVTLISTLCFATEDISLEDLLAAANNSNTEILTTGETTEGNETAQAEEENEWVSNDLYLIEDKVELNKIVDGNVFVIANEVTISNEIGGDVFIVAKKINIDGGYIYSSLFAAGNEVTINGVVCDAYIVAENLTIGENGYIYRDLRASANEFNLNGAIRRNAFVAAVNYNLNSENGTLIGGNFTYTGPSEITVPENSVLGEVIFNKEQVEVKTVGEKIRSYISDALNSLIFVVVVALLATWLAPKFVDRVAAMGTGKAFVSLGIGFATIVAVPVSIILLLIGGVTAKVAVALALVFILVCMAGSAIASLFFGYLFAKLLKWNDKPKFVIASVVSALIIWLISQIPYIGGFIGFIISIFGIGALVVNTFNKKEVKVDNTSVEE